MGIVFFLLLVGPLIFFHELGHYLAAKRFDVKVERFAIGFGPPVLAFHRGETEWSIRAFPLGGYVYMLGIAPEDEVEDADKGRALTDKPIWQRMIIHLAGPVMNLLIPIPIFIAILMGVDARAPASVGMVEVGSPAEEAGLLPGDEIIAVDGHDVRFFDQLQRRVKRADGAVDVTVMRGDEELTVSMTPETVRVRDSVLGLRVVDVARLGIYLREYDPIIHVDPGTPAYAAGLRTFDEVVAMDGEPIDAWSDLVLGLRGHEGTVELSVLRPTPTDDEFGSLFVERPVVVEVNLDGGGIDEIGVQSGILTVFSVQPGSPAETAGVQRGDRVLTLDGERYTSLSQVLERLYTEAIDMDEDHSGFELVVDRDGEEVALSITPITMEVVAEFNTERDATFIGMEPRRSYHDPEMRKMTFVERISYAVGRGIRDTISMILAIVLGVWFMITGAVDTSSLGGPMLIGDMAARAGRAGFEPFMNMMGIISINLGILNLLPIPGLDGGHLMLASMEGVKRGPLSYRTRLIANYVGVAFLVLIMIFVFKNDIERYWGGFANWLNS